MNWFSGKVKRFRLPRMLQTALEVFMAKKSDWVQIHNIVLNPEERSSALPEDTKSHPLEVWMKGWLQQDAKLGDEVEVITRVGRRAKGTLVDERPYFRHGYGELVPEVLMIGEMVRNITFGGDE